MGGKVEPSHEEPDSFYGRGDRVEEGFKGVKGGKVFLCQYFDIVLYGEGFMEGDMFFWCF